MLDRLRSLRAVLAAFVLLLIPIAAWAAAPDWTVDRGTSAVRFAGTHAGRAFNGSFGDWTARIRFDPRDLKTSRIIVVIDTGSATTGDTVQETTLKNPEWFDSSKHRFANFRSTAITSRGGNRYSARGMLEIKGKETPVTLPFTVDINGKKAKAVGALTLDRMALNMGTKSDPTAQWVSRNIELTITIAAARK